MELKDMFGGMANSPVTYLEEDISETDTELVVKDGSGLPEGPNIATLGFGAGGETVFYERLAGNRLLGVVRGFQGEKQPWPGGLTPVARLFTAYDLDTMIENINEMNEHIHAHETGALPHILRDLDTGAAYRYGFIIQGDNICFKAEKAGEENGR